MGFALPYVRRWRCRPGEGGPETALLAEELRRDVYMLAGEIGPRGVHSPERYRLAEAFLTSALRAAGLSVNRLPVPTSTMECANLEAVVRGTAEDRTARPCLVVGAHYDSVPGCPAANDNGSGVAGVLALARRLALRPMACDVRFVLFANEEPPFFTTNDMGSQRYAADCRRRGDAIMGMICLETIGCFRSDRGSQRWPHAVLAKVLPSKGDFVAFVGQSSSRRFLRRAARAFAAQRVFPLLAAAVPSRIDEALWSDHRGFNEVGYEAFMVTDTALLRSEDYHQPTDTPEKLDYASMAKVVGGVAGVIERLAGG